MEFKIEDFVLEKKISSVNPIKKLCYKLLIIYDAPYKVVDRQVINSDVIVHLEGKTIEKTLNFTRLVPYFQREKL